MLLKQGTIHFLANNSLVVLRCKVVTEHSNSKIAWYQRRRDQQASAGLVEAHLGRQTTTLSELNNRIKVNSREGV